MGVAPSSIREAPSGAGSTGGNNAAALLPASLCCFSGRRSPPGGAADNDDDDDDDRRQDNEKSSDSEGVLDIEVGGFNVSAISDVAQLAMRLLFGKVVI